jgi:hypothetical protein
MKNIIKIHCKKLEPFTLHATIKIVKEPSIQINHSFLKEGINLLHFTHASLNTFLDFSQPEDYQIVYFDADNYCTGASYAINNKRGSFSIQTVSKLLLLIPLKSSLSKETINEIKEVVITKHHTYDFSNLSDYELVNTFNGDVCNAGWVYQRSLFLHYLFKEFKKRNIDLGDVEKVKNGYVSHCLRYAVCLIERDGKKRLRQIKCDKLIKNN